MSFYPSSRPPVGPAGAPVRVLKSVSIVGKVPPAHITVMAEVCVKPLTTWHWRCICGAQSKELGYIEEENARKSAKTHLFNHPLSLVEIIDLRKRTMGIISRLEKGDDDALGSQETW